MKSWPSRSTSRNRPLRIVSQVKNNPSGSVLKLASGFVSSILSGTQRPSEAGLTTLMIAYS
jgi:hypothetical protein